MAWGIFSAVVDCCWRWWDLIWSPTSIASEDAFWFYGDLRADLERKGTPIGSLDTLIASHALALNLTLVTNNPRVFADHPDLQKPPIRCPHCGGVMAIIAMRVREINPATA